MPLPKARGADAPPSAPPSAQHPRAPGAPIRTIGLSPDFPLRWNLDAEGNLLGSATFSCKTELLRDASSILLEQKVNNPFDFLSSFNRAIHKLCMDHLPGGRPILDLRAAAAIA